MELNALHNILIRVEQLYKENKIKSSDYRYIALQIELFKRYVRAAEKIPGIKWSDVLASPESYKF